MKPRMNLLVTWDINDKADLILGAFTYESTVQYELTRWEYSHDFRFTDPDEAAAAFGFDSCAAFVDAYISHSWGQRLMMARDRTTLAQASSAPLAEMEAT